MLPEEIDREFREIRTRLEKATQLAREAQLDEAATEFEYLIEMMETSRQDDDRDLMFCIKELADCYLGLHRYTSAASIYLRLHAAQARSGCEESELIVTLFKLAKANEKSGRHKNADSLYAEALQLAEDCLGEGHPLLSNVLESYAAFLKKGNKSAQKAAVLLERARDNRDRSSYHVSDHILEALLAEVDEPGSASKRGKSTSTRFAHSKAEHQSSPRFSLVGRLRVPALMMLALCGLGIYGYANIKRADSIAQIKLDLPKAKVSQDFFQSADGFKTLKVLSDHAAEISFGGTAKKAKLVLNNQMESFFLAKSATVFSFKQATKTALEDGDGTLLYSPIPKSIEAAKTIAEVANKTYLSTNEYPQDFESLAVAPQTKDGLQIVYLGTEGSPAEEAAARLIASKGLLAKESKPVRDSVHMYYSLSSDGGSLRATHLFVRPFDGLGECYTSSVPEQAAYLELSNGRDITFDTVIGAMRESERSRLDKDEVVVVLPAR